jgi:hypothetical protein
MPTDIYQMWWIHICGHMHCKVQTWLNAAPSMSDSKRCSSDQIFSATHVHTSHKHWKPFRCPIYVLSSNVQHGKPHGKWDESIDGGPGIYLRQLLIHNWSVALILNTQTGRVSPQFHVKFNPSFQMIAQHSIHPSTWQDVAGFHNVEEVKWKEKATKKQGHCTKQQQQ